MTRWPVVGFVASLIAVVVPVPGAAAQPPSPSVVEQAGATPPPLPPGVPPPDDPAKPDLDYRLKGRCVGPMPGGAALRERPWGQTLLRVDQLHTFATGKGQTVAVIDTGVNPHVFLDGRLTGGGDYVVARDNGLRDCDGHGTAVAGIIAANPPADSGIGFSGVAPAATVVSIRQTSLDYEGTDQTGQSRDAGTVVTLAQSIVHAADRVPHGVINISINRCRPAVDGAIAPEERRLQAALRYAVEVRDAVVVTSAGNLGEAGCLSQNTGPDPSRPAIIVIPPWFSEYVLSVAAIDRNGDLAPFSMWGPWVSVAAPGTDITSLDPGNAGTLSNRKVDDQGRPAEPVAGTSFAAPYVAGTAALIRERFPALSARQVMTRIEATATHPAAPGGRDNQVGYGMIDPIGALAAEIPGEHGVAADQPIDIDFVPPPPAHKDWTPAVVALIGSTGGLAALLLTLFVLHAIRRRN